MDLCFFNDVRFDVCGEVNILRQKNKAKRSKGDVRDGDATAVPYYYDSQELCVILLLFVLSHHYTHLIDVHIFVRVYHTTRVQGYQVPHVYMCIHVILGPCVCCSTFMSSTCAPLVKQVPVLNYQQVSVILLKLKV